MTESELQQQVAGYLRLRYPGVVFHSDYGSGVKLTARQAAIQKRQNGGLRGWPDMFIAHPVPRCIDGSWDYQWCGLFIELKKAGTRLKKKNGEWATPHIAEQAKLMELLRERGFVAEFAVGYFEAKSIIDDYLKLEDIQNERR